MTTRTCLYCLTHVEEEEKDDGGGEGSKEIEGM